MLSRLLNREVFSFPDREKTEKNGLKSDAYGDEGGVGRESARRAHPARARAVRACEQGKNKGPAGFYPPGLSSNVKQAPKLGLEPRTL